MEVIVTNIEEVRVRVTRIGPEFDLRIQIRREDGRAPELTDYAKQVLGRLPRGSIRGETIGKGETSKEKLDLRKMYVLAPGTYAVTVSRDVFVGERKIELQARTTLKIP